MPSLFAATLHQWAGLIRLGRHRSGAYLFITLFKTAGSAARACLCDFKDIALYFP